MALSCLRRQQIHEKMRRRVFLIFMMWRIYIANSRSVWMHPINNLHMQKGEFYTLYLDLRHFQPKFFSMYCKVIRVSMHTTRYTLTRLIINIDPHKPQDGYSMPHPQG